MNMLDWSILRDFLTVAETGSLSQAARKLRVSQPTLSRRVAELERQLKSQLFQRTPRGLILTDAGDAVLTGARRVEAEALAIERQAEAAQVALTGTVRLSLTEGLGARWLPGKLAAFHAAYPGVCIEILVDNRPLNLLRREADIAVRMFRPDQPDLIAKQVGVLKMGLYGAKDYVARRGTPMHLADLQTHDHVGFDEAMRVRPEIQRLESYFRPERIVHRSSSFLGQLEATAAGIGLGVHDCVLADPDPRLVRLLPRLIDHPMEIWLATHADMRRTPRMRAVFDFLADAFAADAARISGISPPLS
jgi:DNA-binding transcriptional LysR family regulator